jgi:hypothetical protein
VCSLIKSHSLKNDKSGPTGTWHLKKWFHNNPDPYYLHPISIDIRRSNNLGSYEGFLHDEKGEMKELDNISWDRMKRQLEFSIYYSYNKNGPNYLEWYSLKIVEGIMVGRFTPRSYFKLKPFSYSKYSNHITGWNEQYIDKGSIVPRVYDIVLDGKYRGLHDDRLCRAFLRIDRAQRQDSRKFIGRMKVYAVGSGSFWNIDGEELEYDLDISCWNGRRLEFSRKDPRPGKNWVQNFIGEVNCQTISGTFLHEPGYMGSLAWRGCRAEILSYGLGEKTPARRKEWQSRTRLQLYHLMMSGNPAPVKRTVLETNIGKYPTNWIGDRDDDANSWPQRYKLTEIKWIYNIPNPCCKQNSITRYSHGWIAIPNEINGIRPAVLALNGHGGSAWDVVQPNAKRADLDSIYWYGDAYARRGYVVLAVDISHRDDSPLYGPNSPRYGPDYWSPWGDDPSHGNGPHASIRPDELESSDWEENGERVWDAMRALEYLISLPFVDSRNVIVTGLSMGGEIATIVGALDTRVSVVVASGWSPDTGVFYNTGHKCSNWVYADNREYLDTSDFHALIPPRSLIIQTGREDHVWSLVRPFFSADKAVARRSRVAYGKDKKQFIHYLHYDEHEYHVGDKNSYDDGGDYEPHIQTPIMLEPEYPGEIGWQTEMHTYDSKDTLFDCIKKLNKSESKKSCAF